MHHHMHYFLELLYRFIVLTKLHNQIRIVGLTYEPAVLHTSVSTSNAECQPWFFVADQGRGTNNY